jgi:hypothetical protein
VFRKVAPLVALVLLAPSGASGQFIGWEPGFYKGKVRNNNSVTRAPRARTNISFSVSRTHIRLRRVEFVLRCRDNGVDTTVRAIGGPSGLVRLRKGSRGGGFLIQGRVRGQRQMTYSMLGGIYGTTIEGQFQVSDYESDPYCHDPARFKATKR